MGIEDRAGNLKYAASPVAPSQDYGQKFVFFQRFRAAANESFSRQIRLADAGNCAVPRCGQNGSFTT